MPAAARRAAYACDITYCTAKELVFDYLRDCVAAPRGSTLEQRAAALGGAPAPQPLLRGLNMAIIDEADSILIDEARVPLVLSQSVAGADEARLRQAWQLSASLQPGSDFHADTTARSARLTAAGRDRLRTPGAAAPWLNARQREDMVALALTARHLLRRGRDFVMEAGQVHIVDETTGRKAAGRSWSQGLQQLVELKEGCKPSAPVVTLAQITYQRFFPRYFRLCGMSGTLLESRRELHRIYDLHVVPVPLRVPGRRRVLPPRAFADAAALWPAVAARVREMHALGRPVLVGTGSVLDSETLSRHLSAGGLKHAVLNASQDQHEARIVAAAGAPGAITVATNMAGRGTDILLHETSRAAGGLHIICCQQNASRRIDRQLMGRCARQGDPGSVEFFVALDGPMLAQHYAAATLKKLFINKYLCYDAGSIYLLRSAQRGAERRERREREILMRRDQQVDDWFAFSGSEH
jgi:preprotein translocase subunit SecA